jgi:hypothetical protein
LKYLLILLFIIPFISNAQIVNGYIYDYESTVKGAKLINTTQTILKFSDEKGRFTIEAKLKDTLVISSYFHATKTIIITPDYFKQDVVIELHKMTNQLDAVEITKVIEKKFDSVLINIETKNQLANDIKNRPYLYGAQPSSNIDFIAIGRLISRLFKKKNKTTDIVYIKTEDLMALFENNRLFNQALLISELKISKELQYLFFEYCCAQNINKTLLIEHRDIELLDYLIVSGEEFNALVDNHVKD